MTSGGVSNMAPFETAVREILQEVGARPDLSAVSNSDSLLSTGVIDSVAMVGLVSAIEGRFGISIGDDELTPEHFDSVVAIARLILSKGGVS